MKIVFGVLLCIPLLIITSYRVVKDIQFERNVEGYLKRAADSNTVDLAKTELGKVVKYIEENDMTKGFTSIIYTTPDEDVKFWYDNLKSSLKELETLSPTATPLERSNMLIKLRETLLDSGDKTVKVTVPTGISIYPNNTLLCFIYTICFIIFVIGAVLIGIGWDDF
jgi:hypothetical protein